MSSDETPSQDDTPQRSGQGTPNSGQASNIIEFVDSQDPNSRSAIQRHTAYHSAAQRRDTRSRLLRRSSQARYLPWTRRPQLDAGARTSSASSGSSLSISPAPSMRGRSEQRTRASSSDRETVSTTQSRRKSVSENVSSSVAVEITAADRAVLSFFTSSFCRHEASRSWLEPSITSMQEHDSSGHLLLAYAYAGRRMHPTATSNPQDQVDAERHLGRGTNALWNQLQLQDQATSDANVQSVLLLIAYTADFGAMDDVQLHVDALRTMVDQRGGISAFVHNPALHLQLLAIDRARRFHLTFGCVDSCPDVLRFPDGLRLPAGRILG